jgi:hypothetical protein
VQLIIHHQQLFHHSTRISKSKVQQFCSSTQWQLHHKPRTTTRQIISQDLTIMSPHNPSTDRQPKARATLLRCRKWLK